ncbi:MAG: hypothetical protein GY820_46165 [Gammaproteobacteria bacterium]|nr:hypothetical protein [Gammaproteobacteria bacterium]
MELPQYTERWVITGNYKYRLVIIRSGTITGVYSEGYCTGKRSNWSLANERRGCDDRVAWNANRGGPTEEE